VRDLNLGPHIQVELSGPSRELVTFFLKISKIGGGSLWGPVAKKLDLRPPIFFRDFRSTLALQCTREARKKSVSCARRIQGSKFKNPKFPKKIPQKLGGGGRATRFET